MSYFEIIWKALILPSKNWRLFLSIYLISFLAYFILDYLLHLPLFLLFDIPLFLLFDIPLFLFDIVWFIVDAVVEAVTIYAVVEAVTIYAVAMMTQTEQLFTMGELLRKIKGVIEGPIITQAYVHVLQNIYNSFWFILLSSSSSSSSLPLYLISLDHGLVRYILNALLYLVKLIWLISLRTVWTLSITVSVVEKGCYGVGAFRRAAKILRGKRWIGALINLLALMLLNAPESMRLFLFPSSSWPIWMMAVCYFVLLAMSVILNLFVLAAITMYYYECRRSHEEQVIIRSYQQQLLLRRMLPRVTPVIILVCRPLMMHILS